MPVSGSAFADAYGLGLHMTALASLYPQRTPVSGEIGFFQQHPEVAGYAAPDKQVVLNPLFQGSQESVLGNERLRQLFYDYPHLVPENLSITNHQIPSDTYAADPVNNRATILSRLLSGDPSGSPYTIQQHEAAFNVLEFLRQLQTMRQDRENNASP